MRKSIALLAILAGLGAVFGLFAAPAGAGGLSPPVADCDAHGQLTRTYSAAQLRNALATMPADINEYTNCHDVIQRALLQKLGKLKSGDLAGGGGSFLPTWVLIVLVLLVLGGVGFGVVALRNRNVGD